MWILEKPNAPFMYKNKLKLILFLLFCFVGFTNTEAQRIKWLVHSDAGFNNVIYHNSSTAEVRKLKQQSGYTWMYGAKVDIKITNAIYIQTGITYLKLIDKNIDSGFRRSSGFGQNTYFRETKHWNTVKSSYFGFPLSLKIGTEKGGLIIGIQRSLFLQSDRTTIIQVSDERLDPIGNTFNYSMPPEKGSKEKIKLAKFDLGINLGIAINIYKELSLGFNMYLSLKSGPYEKSLSREIIRRSHRLYTFGVSYYL